jgi:hypothetical protein
VLSGHDAAAPPAETPERLRVFGRLLAVFLLLVGGLRWHRGGNPAPWDAAAVLSVLAAWLRPALLGGIYRTWMKAARVVGKANAFLVLGAVYYLVVAPYGFLLRTFGKDPLSGPEAENGSFWIRRAPPGGAERYERPF